MRLLAAILLVSTTAFGSLDFTSSNSHGISYPVAPITNQTVSAAAFVNRAAFGSFSILHASDGGAGGLLLRMNSTDRFQGLSLDSGGGGGTTTITTDSSYLSRWVHVAMVNHSTTLRVLYVDGLPVHTNTSSATLPSMDRVCVGIRISGGSVSNPWLGLLCRASVWDTALTADDVAQLAAGINPEKIQLNNLRFNSPLTSLGSGVTINTVGPPLNLTNTVAQAISQPPLY